MDPLSPPEDEKEKEKEVRNTTNRIGNERQKRIKVSTNSDQFENFLFSEYDLKEKELVDIIDTPRLQSIMDDFYDLTNIGIAIIDMKGEVLVATGWQDICTEFHRDHPETEKLCIQSDIYLTQDVEPGEFLIYKCKNNMWDMATPIIVGDTRIGTLFLGQFFFDNEKINYDFFENQAEKYGFDKEEYLKALEEVPRWSRKKINFVMRFYTKFAQMISDLSYKNLLLKKLVKEQRHTEKILRTSKKQLKEALDHAEFYRDLVSHDIANKLTNINLSIQLLEEIDSISKHQDKMEEFIDIIKQEAKEGQSIISRVRKLSKVVMENPKTKSVHIKKLITSAISNTKARFQNKPYEIITNLPEKDITIQGGALLMDAFENILINGALHNESNIIKIWIKLSVINKNGKEMVKLEFKDNGVGIPKEDKEKLFQKSPKHHSERGGMGIGLSLVKNIILSYGGEIWIENRISDDYSKGSNFILLLNKM
jgi:signal transduction histidine kinase